MNPTTGPKNQDIVAVAAAKGCFAKLLDCVATAGLTELLRREGPFSLFAPTDEAFAKLSAETIEQLLEPKHRERLRAILAYHLVPGRYRAVDLGNLKTAKTAHGGSLTVLPKGGGLVVDGARIVQTDILCSNGVIHAVDAVLFPEE